jgi:hypothetical protein
MASQAQKTLDFGPWEPDLSSIANNDAAVILNVYPRKDGFGPFQSLQGFTQALPAGCRGFFFARRSDGSIAVFAGTITDLYLLDNTTFNWVRVSKGGVSYSPLVASSNWSFAQFNDLVIAVQVNTAPQKYTLASGGNFADLGGSPPSAGFVSIVGFFVVLSALLSNSRRVQWSDLGAPESWTAGVGLADFQDMSDGGNVINLSGGDAFGVIFQQESIRSITYAPGSAVVFQIARISTQETLFADNSIINVGNRTFYCGAAGFKMIVGSGDPVPIGKERVDRTFFTDVDRSNLQLIIGASDPTSTRVYWAYKSQSGSTTQFDSILLYDYALDKWAKLMVSGEFIGSLAKPGLTLEQLDAIAPGALSVTGAANNGAGLIRLTLNAISTPQFMIAGQNFIVVQGVVGTVEANGTWVVNIINSTHIDLVGSTFTNAYVSGGAIGGSLDDLPFSLDSISKSSNAQLAAFNSSNQLGFFNGPNLEAILETGDGDPVGNTVEINGVRPITDCATAMCSIGMRMSPADTVSYSAEVVVDDQGWAEAYVETRYARGRMRAPAGAAWTFATGIQPDVAIAGDA